MAEDFEVEHASLILFGDPALALAVGLAVLGGGVVSALAGFALPWAGFFWAKMFFWKGIIQMPTKKGKGGR